MVHGLANQVSHLFMGTGSFLDNLFYSPGKYFMDSSIYYGNKKVLTFPKSAETPTITTTSNKTSNSISNLHESILFSVPSGGAGASLHGYSILSTG